MRYKFWSITVTIVALLACGTPTDGCGCSPPPNYEIALVGFVTHGNGPVVDARVHGVYFSAGCSQMLAGGLWVNHEDSVDVTGHYALRLASYRPDTLCVRLAAYSGSDSVVRDSIPLMMSIPHDSIRVDFSFP